MNNLATYINDDLTYRRTAALRNLINLSDGNTEAQLVAAAGKALRALPRVHKPEPCKIYLPYDASEPSVRVNVAAQDGGYDYEWMESTLTALSFEEGGGNWYATGEITAVFGAARATVTLHALAPTSVIALMRDMGFIHWSAPHLSEGYSSFACGV